MSETDKVKNIPDQTEINKKTIQIRELELTAEDIEELLPSYANQEKSEQAPSVENDTQRDTVENHEPKIEDLVKDIEDQLKLGYSYEDIAKQLNKGKTEIELLHKFRQNN